MIKFFKKQTIVHPIEAALLQLAPKSIVKELAIKVAVGELIQAVALSISQKPDLLLAEVAQRLDLKPCHRITIIDKQTIAQCGFSSEALLSRSIFVVPDINTKYGYTFIVADPKQISLSEFYQIGHSVKLAMGSTIAAAWVQFQRFSNSQSVELTEQQLFRILHALAATAKQHGASSLRIIANDNPSYQFHVGTKEFRGSLQQSVVDAINHYAQDSITFSDEEISAAPSINVRQTKQGSQIAFDVQWQVAHVVTHPNYKTIDATSSHNQEIVIIDDEPRFANVLKSMLQVKNYSVVCFSDSREAFAAIRDGDVAQSALLVCDVHMPNIDGPSLVRLIREAGLQHRIVMLTSDTDDLLEAEMALLGIDAFVKKQSNPKVLLAWLQNIATKQQADQTQQQPANSGLRAISNGAG